MTKLVSLRVVVATDDAVEMKDIKPRLAEIIRAAEATEGESGAIYWMTADVLQGPEGRANPRRTAGKPRVVAGQGELA
jgi:hypothetical protein